MVERKRPHVHPVDEAWLALGAEERLSPEIEIVDSHIHLWDFSTPPYFADSYARDAEAEGITASVYVDCTMAYREDGPVALEPVGEVEFARAQAESHAGPVDVAAAIIGWADLTLGDGVLPVLETMAEAGGPRYRGIRSRANYDPDPHAGYGPMGVAAGLMLRDDYRRGLSQVQAFGQAFDLYAFHTQLGEVADLARAFPDLPIILNHIGGPIGIGRYASRRDQVYADWAAGMTELATCPNVLVKIGGFAISRLAIVDAGGRDRPPSSGEVADKCRPWVEHCLIHFGPERCLFGSNFPVDKAVMPLRTLINAMKRLTAHLAPAEQQAFFAGNARKVYRI